MSFKSCNDCGAITTNENIKNCFNCGNRMCSNCASRSGNKCTSCGANFN